MASRAAMEDELLSRGYSTERIASSFTYAQEGVLYERAQLDTTILQEQYGYSEDQIQILKNYEGQDLAEYPQIRAVTSTLEGRIGCHDVSNTSCTAYFSWGWSTAPDFYNFTDFIGVRWRGTGSDAGEVTLNFDAGASSSKCTVMYYSYPDDTLIETVTVPYDGGNRFDPNGYTSYSFDRLSSTGTGYTKIGLVQTKVDLPSGTTGSLVQTAFIYKYGLAERNLSIGLSFPVSFSINLEDDVAEAFGQSVLISSDGSVYEY